MARIIKKKEKNMFYLERKLNYLLFCSAGGSALLAFRLYNVHSISNVTEGILGLMTSLEHWFEFHHHFQFSSDGIVLFLRMENFETFLVFSLYLP